MNNLIPPEHKNETDFGERLTYLREMYGINRTELAEKISINRISIWKYEKCERLPNADTLIKIANLFYVSIDWLLGRDISEDTEQPGDFKDLKRRARIEELKKELAELEESK